MTRKLQKETKANKNPLFPMKKKGIINIPYH